MIESGGFLGRLLGPLLKTGLSLFKNVIKPLTKSVDTSLLGNMLASKGINRAGYDSKDLQFMGGNGIIRACYRSKRIFNQRFLIPPHLLTNFEIQKYYQNEPRFNGVYSRGNLPNKIEDWPYVKNLDEYFDNVTHWIALYAFNNVTYFDSFGVEHIPKEIEKFIGNKNTQTNILRIQAYNSVMHGYFCIEFFQQILLIFFHQMISKKMTV